MSILAILNRFVTNSQIRFDYLAKAGIYNRVSDTVYLQKKYKIVFGKNLDLKNPQTFNEKLQWLKLYNRKPEYTTMVDKHAVKKYIADRIGEEYIIPTLGLWDEFDDIDFESLPNQFVLKCTHDSGGLVICKNKTELDYKAAKKKLTQSLRRNYYFSGREWPYKNVKPRIIAEKYMMDDTIEELLDYKFFCFNGICKCFKVDFDRFVEHHANYYDSQGHILDFGEVDVPSVRDKQINLPESLPEMISLAEKLSAEHPFLRVDFYDVNGTVYFGELTFYPASGFGRFTDDKWDYKLGEWIELPG